MLLSVMALLCLNFCAVAQSLTQDIKPLNLGDTLPNAVRNMPLPVVNHPEGNKTITLNHYPGKLIILDFWATWCSSCIKKFPALYSLERETDHQLKVLLVNSTSTKDDHEKIKRFLIQRKAAYQFTSIVGDTVLRKLFPHSSIPHYAWIKENKVIAITDADGITKENVERALTGRELKATSIKIVYDPSQPLFEDKSQLDIPNYIYKSAFAPYLEGFKRNMYTNKNEEGLISKLTITNSPLIDFYRYAYPFLADITAARMILNITTPEKLSSNSTTASWKTSNFYNYEALFSPRPRGEALKILQADLNNIFGYRVTTLEREISCWVLKVTDVKKLTKFPKTGKRETNLFDGTGLPIFYNNSPIQSLVFELERIYRQPFIDETRLEIPVTLSLPADLLDSVKLQSSLSTQGLSLTKETRKIQMAIFSNK